MHTANLIKDLYALMLSIGFLFVGTVAILGIFIGMDMRDAIKNSKNKEQR